MKRFILFLLFITLYSCGSSRVNDYAYVKGWAYKEMPPSQAVTNGEVIYEGKLSNGKIFSVLDDGTLNKDDRMYYYNALYQDFGWYRDMDGDWESYGGTRIKRGHLYINIKRGAAVYFYPEKEFYTFKVKVYPKGTILLDPLLNN
tara:strand:- start:45 stop:479 length:435 start_codon:yes stop_codon:yes gene_type:complete